MVRELDIVIVGASGYTGRLCTKYFATELPSMLRWAIAGRSKGKLEKLVAYLSNIQDVSEPSKYFLMVKPISGPEDHVLTHGNTYRHPPSRRIITGSGGRPRQEMHCYSFCCGSV
jgi:hypothetical protein